MKTVLVFGTFDIIHPGHRWFLRNASQLGDHLVAVVSRDSFVQEWKGKKPVENEKARIRALEESGLVNKAVLSDSEIGTYKVVTGIQPDIICLGHDQKALQENLEAWLNRTRGIHPEIHILQPWRRERYSSSIRNRALQGAGLKNPHSVTIMTWLLIVSMIVFGFSWISGKRISSSAPPGVLSLIRASITALCFLPLLLWSRKKRLSSDNGMRGWLWTAASALSIAAYNLFFFSGLAAGPAGKGGLIVTTLNPVFTFLIISVTAGKKIGKSASAGLLLGFLGGILLLEPWGYRLGGVGNSAFLFAALSWSLLTVFSRKALSSLDFRIFNLRLHSLAALLLLPVAIHETGGRIPAGLGIPFWSDMILIAALAGAVGTGIYFMATSRLGADRTSSFSYLIPVSAVLFSGILLGEKPELMAAAGGILAVAAIFIINRRN